MFAMQCVELNIMTVTLRKMILVVCASLV